MNFEAFHHYQEKYRAYLKEEEERKLPLVRVALRTDISAIIALLPHLWPQYKLDDVRLCALFENDFVETSRKCWFVVEREQIIVAAMSVRTQDHLWCVQPLLHIDELVVHANSQRLGIGRLLIHTAEGFAREHKCHAIELETGLQRANAHQFYAAQGFTEVAKYFSKELS